MALKEIVGRRRLRQRGLWSYTGYRTFLCLAHEAIPAARSLYGTTFPDLSGSHAPVMYDPLIIWDPEGVRGTAMIVAKYITPGITVLPAGQAVLYSTPVRTKREIVWDLDGKIVAGKEARGKTEWEVVRGDNVVFDYNLMLRLETNYDRTDDYLEYAMNLQGKINDADLRKFGNARRGTLLFHGARRRRQKLDRRIQVSYWMEFNPVGWNNSVWSRAGSWHTIQTSVREENDKYDSSLFPALSGDGKPVVRYVAGYIEQEKPSADTEPLIAAYAEPRRLYEYGPFSALHALEIP